MMSGCAPLADRCLCCPGMLMTGSSASACGPRTPSEELVRCSVVVEMLGNRTGGDSAAAGAKAESCLKRSPHVRELGYAARGKAWADQHLGSLLNTRAYRKGKYVCVCACVCVCAFVCVRVCVSEI